MVTAAHKETLQAAPNLAFKTSGLPSTFFIALNNARWPFTERAVRQALMQRQRAFRQPPGLVADGRDMGTVVFPDAALKIFLTASPEIRAQRRYKHLIEKGITANLAALSRDLAERDARDASRAVAPLKPAADSQVLDSSALSVEEVADQVLKLWHESNSGGRG